MKNTMLRALAFLAGLIALPSLAQPGPPPNPWVTNGAQVSYSQGCVIIPITVTGGCEGAGTLNTTGLYVAGVSVRSASIISSGVLAVGNGGTGLSAGTSGGVPYYIATNFMASSGALAANGFVLGGGPGNPPTTVSITGLVLGHGSSAPTAYAGTGSCSAGQFINALSGSGVSTCGAVSLPGDVVYTDQNQTFTKAQRGQPVVVSPSGATYTPNFDAANNFPITLVHASCPCTFANPSTTPVAGQSGVIVVIQSATGSDTIGTWGSDYISAGGTSTIALSTAANAMDFFSYYVQDATHIVVSAGALNATH